MAMVHETQHGSYTPAQVAAITGLPITAVHKAIERKLIHPKRIRKGRIVERMLSRSQAVYLQMEAKGLRSLPLATRRQVAQAVERDPGIDAMSLSEGSVVLIQVKSARQQVDTGLRRLERAARIVESNPEIMHGTPVYKGTRIPVITVADMLSQGTSIEEILEGYPALTREMVTLAPLYVRAFPRRGRPPARPWAKRKPRRVSRHDAT
jgi:uncharacterized protein (DUF433 family)